MIMHILEVCQCNKYVTEAIYCTEVVVSLGALRGLIAMGFR